MLITKPETVRISNTTTKIERNQPPFLDVKLTLSAANTERRFIFRIDNSPETIKSFNQAQYEVDKIDKAMFTWVAYLSTALGIFLRYGFVPER